MPEGKFNPPRRFTVDASKVTTRLKKLFALNGVKYLTASNIESSLIGFVVAGLVVLVVVGLVAFVSAIVVTSPITSCETEIDLEILEILS